MTGKPNARISAGIEPADCKRFVGSKIASDGFVRVLALPNAGTKASLNNKYPIYGWHALSLWVARSESSKGVVKQ